MFSSCIHSCTTTVVLNFQGDVVHDVDEYKRYMTICNANVRQGVCMFDKLYFGERGHLEAIALLYDICIYVYVDSAEAVKGWQVFNRDAAAGFICLLNAHNHFSVLHGTGHDVRPQIPSKVDYFGYSRSALD